MSRTVLLLIAAVVGVAAIALLVWRLVRRARPSRLVAPEERADRVALRMLRETSMLLDDDADPARPREVSFYLYFSTRAAAERAAAQVATLRVDVSNLSVLIEPAARGATWLCLVTVEIVPNEHEMRRACAELRVIATAHGGELDGWEAALPW